MKDIILEKFAQWTKELSPKEARIKIFGHIRDIPYYLVPQMKNPYEWAASVLEAHKGSCSPKHYLLGILFGKLGIPVKYASYSFRWDKQPLKYPQELKKLALLCPTGYHVACKVNINTRPYRIGRCMSLHNKWILVDATWDRGLIKAGFPVNVNWDGLSNTLNAVLPFEETIHESLQERLDFVGEKRKQASEAQIATYAQFIEKLNAWLEALRHE